MLLRKILEFYMILHSKEIFNELIETTAGVLGIPAVL